MNNATAVSSNPKIIAIKIVITIAIVPSLLPVSVGPLVAVLVMDIVLLIDGVLVATVIVLITSELVDGIILAVITVDRQTP